jgi:hypothetical protein
VAQHKILRSAIGAGVGLLVIGLVSLAALTKPASPVSPAVTSAASSSAVASTTPTPSVEVSPAPVIPPTGTAAGSAGASDTVMALLATLPTDDAPDSHTGYKRDLFKLWIDADGNGCNTRAEVLISESSTSTSHTGTCTISLGKWFSGYDGQWITVASQLDIDHFVPLSEAWKSGAYAWDAATRKAFANDLGYAASLIAVSASTNRAKGDSDPASWMPPNASFACTYVSTWVAVKYRWSLTVDSRERTAITTVLSGCGSLTLEPPARASISNG